jgi:hypothetical protein
MGPGLGPWLPNQRTGSRLASAAATPGAATTQLLGGHTKPSCRQVGCWQVNALDVLLIGHWPAGAEYLLANPLCQERAQCLQTCRLLKRSTGS